MTPEPLKKVRMRFTDMEEGHIRTMYFVCVHLLRLDICLKFDKKKSIQFHTTDLHFPRVWGIIWKGVPCIETENTGTL